MKATSITSLAGMLLCIAGLATGASASSNSGVVVLHQTAGGALTMSGQAKILVPAGHIYVNSNASDAVKGSGITVIDTPILYTRGGIQNSGKAICFGQIVNVAATYEDPLSTLSLPNGSGMPNHGNKSISGGTVVLQPGRYGTISISSNPHVTFEPGVYVINGSGLSISGQPTIVGEGVTLIINSGSLSLSGQAKIIISPPEEGPLAGIVFAQPPSNTSTMSLSGDANFGVLGTIYAPGAHANISGQGTVEGDGPQMGDLMVIRSATISGQGLIKIGRPELKAIQLMQSPLLD